LRAAPGFYKVAADERQMNSTQTMRKTVINRASIGLGIGGVLLLLRFCVTILLGIHNHEPGGEATIFQGLFLIFDLLVSAYSMVPWLLLTRSHTLTVHYWQWYFALDFLITGLIWGLTEAFVVWCAARWRK
jgi:hypothetical protein